MTDTIMNTKKPLHKYREGLHHKSVHYCPDCDSETDDSVVRLQWADPPDIVEVPAKSCDCNPSRVQKLKATLNWVLQ